MEALIFGDFVSDAAITAVCEARPQHDAIGDWVTGGNIADAVAANDEWAGSVRVTPFVTGAGLEVGTAAPLAAAAWENGPTLDLASVQARDRR